MSVSFHVPGCGTQILTCQFCEEAKARGDQPGFNGGYCDDYCTGQVEEPACPSTNFGNANARSVLSLLGFDGTDLWGEADPATLRQRVFRARNTDRSSALRDSEHLAGGHAGMARTTDADGTPRIERMGAASYAAGNTDEQTLRRLDSVENIAKWAQDNGFTVVSWG